MAYATLIPLPPTFTSLAVVDAKLAVLRAKQKSRPFDCAETSGVVGNEGDCGGNKGSYLSFSTAKSLSFLAVVSLFL